jgi:hypothetical protein
MFLFYLLGLYLGVGVVWFVIHFDRVRHHDLTRENPVGTFRAWEWPLVFIITTVLWPVAIWYYINGRPVSI